MESNGVSVKSSLAKARRPDLKGSCICDDGMSSRRHFSVPDCDCWSCQLSTHSWKYSFPIKNIFHQWQVVRRGRVISAFRRNRRRVRSWTTTGRRRGRQTHSTIGVDGRPLSAATSTSRPLHRSCRASCRHTTTNRAAMTTSQRLSSWSQ